MKALPTTSTEAQSIYHRPAPQLRRFPRQLQHEDQDAQTTPIGVSISQIRLVLYGTSPAARAAGLQKPTPSCACRWTKVNRDVLFSFGSTAWSMSETGAANRANCWRTTGDIATTGAACTASGKTKPRSRRRPGTGTPDMLVVGQVGWGVPTRATSRERAIMHISMWCMLSPAPHGCD